MSKKGTLFHLAIICTILISTPFSTASGTTRKVLFLGNSYTATNNLPQLIDDLAQSSGDNMVYEATMPGGYTFQQHSSDPAAIGLIMQGNWDFVVLQEQSQRPSFPDGQVEVEVYPYARKLDSLVKAYNPCAKTVFYMTWGRKNGDPQNCAFFPPLCTYQGMDSLLQLRYTIMAEENEAVICPVARLWRKIIANQPGIELYSPDQSHPSQEGSYAAACSFYSILFRKDPSLCTYNGNLSAANAATIRNTAKQIVYDSLSYWYRFEDMPVNDFSYQSSGLVVSFSSNIANAPSLLWNFGDGATATISNPVHTYNSPGNYYVKLKTEICGHSDTITKLVTVGTNSIGHNTVDDKYSLYPNPAVNRLYISTPDGIESLALCHINGTIILQESKVNRTETMLNVESLSPGVYYVILRTKGTQKAIRFLKA